MNRSRKRKQVTIRSGFEGDKIPSLDGKPTRGANEWEPEAKEPDGVRDYRLEEDVIADVSRQATGGAGTHTPRKAAHRPRRTPTDRSPTDLTPVQREIVRMLRSGDPRYGWQTFYVKRPIGDRGLTPFLTFPGARLCVYVLPTRLRKKDRAAIARRAGVIRNILGHEEFDIETDDFMRDPDAVMRSLHDVLWRRSPAVLADDPAAWAEAVAGCNADGQFGWARSFMTDAEEERLLDEPEQRAYRDRFVDRLDDPKA